MHSTAFNPFSPRVFPALVPSLFPSTTSILSSPPSLLGCFRPVAGFSQHFRIRCLRFHCCQPVLAPYFFCLRATPHRSQRLKFHFHRLQCFATLGLSPISRSASVYIFFGSTALDWLPPLITACVPCVVVSPALAHIVIDSASPLLLAVTIFMQRFSVLFHSASLLDPFPSRLMER